MQKSVINLLVYILQNAKKKIVAKIVAVLGHAKVRTYIFEFLFYNICERNIKFVDVAPTNWVTLHKALKNNGENNFS